MERALVLLFLCVGIATAQQGYTPPTPIPSTGHFSYGTWGSTWKFLNCGTQVCGEAFISYDCATSKVLVAVTPRPSFTLEENSLFLAVDDVSLVRVTSANFMSTNGSMMADAVLLQGRYDIFLGAKFTGFERVVVSDNLATECKPDVLVTVVGVPGTVQKGLTYTAVWSVQNIGTPSSVAEGVVSRFTVTAGLRIVSHDIPAGLVQSSTETEIVAAIGDLAAGPAKVFNVVLIADRCDGGSSIIVHASALCDEPLENNQGKLYTYFTSSNVRVVKTCPADAVAGENRNYLVTVSNVGTAAAKDVVVVDALPAGVEYVSNNANGVFDATSRAVTFALAAPLAAGGSASFSITVKIVAMEGALTNVVTVSTASVECPAEEPNTDNCTVVPTTPDAVMEKECPADREIVSGKTYSYVLKVRNSGTAPAKNVQVVDQLPAGLTYLTGSRPVASNVNGTITYAVIPSLAVGEEVTITYSVRVDATEGSLSNTATVTVTGVELTTTNNAASCVRVVVTPDIKVTKACPAELVIGTTASYLVTVTNVGNTAAENVVLKDVLPTGVSYVSASVSPASPAIPASVSGQTLTWTIGSVAAGQTLTFTVVVKANNNAAGVLTNNVVVTTTSVEAPTAKTNNNDTCSNTVIYPDLAVAKECVGNFTVLGQPTTYKITITNIGTAPALNSTLVDTLPAGVTFVSSSISPSTQVGQALGFALGDVAPGQTIAVTIVASVQATSGGLVNKAVVSTASVEGGLVATNNNAACTQTATAPDVSVAKVCPTDFVLGTPRDYSITVRNSGSATALNVVLVDTLPQGATYHSAVPAPSSIVGSVLTWNLGDILANAAPLTFVVTVKVDGVLDVSKYTNNVVVTTTSEEGFSGTSNNNANCTNTLTWADVAISKECPATMTNGDNIVYVIKASNIGSADAGAVFVRDQLPAEVQFVSAVPAPTEVAGNELVWSLGTLARAAAPITIRVTVKVIGLQGKPINHVSIETNNTEGGQGQTNNYASCYSDFISPDVSIDKECPEEATIGKNAQYIVTVRNLGNATAKNVIVQDVLSNNVAFVAMISGPAGVKTVVGDAEVITWSLGDLTPGQVVALKFNVYVKPIVGGIDFTSQIVNKVAVNTSSVEAVPVQGNKTDECSSKLVYPDVEVYKFCPVGDVVSGREYTYRVQVDNVGTAPAENVMLYDVLPNGVEFVSVTPLQPVVSRVGQRLTWSIGLLERGASITFVLTVRVTGTNDAEPLINRAYINTTSVEGGRQDLNNDHACGNNLVWSDVSVKKACPEDGGALVSGKTYNYVITVGNSGKAPSDPVVVVDTLPAGVTYVSALPAPANVAAQALTWNFASIAPGSVTTITVTVTVSATAGQLVNAVTIKTNGTEGGNKTENNRDQCTNPVNSPDVSIRKVCPADLVLGSTRNYTITVSNIGTAVAENVIVRDNLPAGLSLVAAWPTASTLTPLTWNVGSLAPGASATVVLSVSVYGQDGVMSYTNTANVTTSSVEGGNGVTNNNAACTNPLTFSDIAVTKECSSVGVVAGKDTTFSIKVSNVGSATSDVVTVTDTLPAGVTYKSATPAPTNVNGQILTWTIASLTAGQSQSISVVGTVDVASGTLTNNVRVETTTEGGNKDANNAAKCDITVIAADIAVEKECADEIILGEQGAFTIRVSNIDLAPADNVVLVDTLPEGLVFAAMIAGPVPTLNAERTVLTWNLSTLASGAVQTFTFNVTVVGLGERDFTSAVVNTATVTTTSIEVVGGKANNEASCQTPIVWPDVDVKKRCPNSGGALVTGRQYTYTLTVTNIGTALARNVVLVDALPEGVVFFSVTPVSPVAKLSANNITWTIGDLHQFASITFIITVNVTGPSTTGILVNSAGATSTSQEGGYRLHNNYANCNNTLTYADLGVKKVCPAGVIVPGTSVTYEILLANLGTAAAENVFVVDTLPAGLVYVSSAPVASVAGQVITWNLGTIAAKANRTFSVTVRVESTSGTLQNSVRVTTTTTETGFGLTNNHDECVIKPVFPDVDITKVCPVDLILGTERTYTIKARNVGAGAAADVVVTDTLPAGLTVVNTVPLAASVVGNVITWNLQTLAPGAEETLLVVVKVGITSGASLTNNVAITTTTPETNTANNKASCSSPYTYPDVKIEKVCPAKSLVSGEEADYVITVTNIGTATAVNVTVEDVLPGQVSFTSAFPAATAVQGQVITWNLGNLLPKGVSTIHVVTRVVSVDGIALNVVTVTADNEDESVRNNNYANCTNGIVSTDISVNKTCPVSVAYGSSEIVQYVITVTNLVEGTSANGVFVSDELPAPVEYVSATPAPSSVNGRTLVWSLGTVSAGKPEIITISVRAGVFASFPPNTQSVTLTNAVTVNTTSTEVNGGSTNNVAECSHPVVWPDVKVTKACPVGTTPLNALFSYTITVTNIGNAVAPAVQVVDTLAAGAQYVGSTSVGAVGTVSEVVAGQVLTFNIGAVAPGATVVLTLSVRALTAVNGTYVNNVVVTTPAIEGGLGTTNNKDSCSHILVAPAVQLTGVCPPKDLIAGATNVFFLTVQNNGNGDARDVTFTGVIAGQLNIVSQTGEGTFSVVGNTLTLKYPVLPAGAQSQITITTTPVAVASGCTTLFYSNFSITSTDPSVSINNQVSCAQRVSSTDIELKKTCPAALAAGSVGTYTLVVSNLGCGDAQAVRLVDTLPEGVVYKSISVSPNTVNATVSEAGQVVTIDLGTLAGGAKVTVSLLVDVVAYKPLYENNAVVTTTTVEGGLVQENNKAKCSSIGGYADISVTKVCPTTLVFPTKASYTITVTNKGTLTAENVSLTDNLSPDVTFYSLSPSDATFTTYNNTQKIVVSVGTLAAGQTKSYSITVQVKFGVTGIVPNEVLAYTSTAELDTVINNNFARCENVVNEGDNYPPRR